MKSIRISSTSIMSLDGLYIDKFSSVSDDDLSSLLDSCAMFFSYLYIDTKYRGTYYIFMHVEFLRDLVGKVDASDICASLHNFLKFSEISELSTPFLKLVVL